MALFGGQGNIISALSYAASSVCILIFNKIVLSGYRFNFPIIMTFFHMVICVVLLALFRRLRLLSYTSFDSALAYKALPLSLCFVGNIVIGMMALKLTNIPMFATLRRLTVLMVIIHEYLLLRKRQSLVVVLAVVIMVLGSLIGGWGDLQFDLLGYCMVILNNIVTALYLVWVKKALSETRLHNDTFGLMYYNSLLAIPFLIVFGFVAGEWQRLPDFPHLMSPGFQISFTISALMSFALNYSIFWCTQANSALTTSVTGQVKNVLSSFVSVFAFGVQATPLLITGLCVGLSGSFLYAFAMFEADQKKKSKDTSEIRNQLSTQLLNSSNHNHLEDNNNRLHGNHSSNDDHLKKDIHQISPHHHGIPMNGSSNDLINSSPTNPESYSVSLPPSAPTSPFGLSNSGANKPFSRSPPLPVQAPPSISFNFSNLIQPFRSLKTT